MSLILIDLIFRKIFNRYQFLPSIHDFIESRQYYEKIINNYKIIFFCPSVEVFGRVQSLYTKEPETLNWIDSFQPNNSGNIIFWDIGANIGLYSIYAAVKFKDIKIISFEPSTSNTRTLSRNLSINNLESKISIFPLALSDNENIISYFNETRFSEGSSFSNFNSDIDYRGEFVKENQIKNKDFKELSIEMNPTYVKQYEFINNIMEKNNFKKIQSLNKRLSSDKNYKLKLNETVNEIFKRNN